MSYFQVLLLLFIVVLVLLVILLVENRKLKQEIKILNEVITIKDTTIANFEASRVAVKDVIENFSAHTEVMQLVKAGECRESISKKLNIPVNKIELIMKFDKIKKEQQH